MDKDNDSLRLIVADNILDFAYKVDKNLQLIRNSNYSYIVDTKLSRFSNSEGRADCYESIRGKDAFFLSDVNNYSICYDMFGESHRMSYDDHFQDVKRMMSATIGTLDKCHIILPLLYQSRQHKREGRQSLDVNMALRELEFHGANSIITFDAHDPNVAGGALGPRTAFDNLYPTVNMLYQFVLNEDIDMNKLIVINPDEGAVKRANYFAKVLGAESGGFKKKRDRSVIEGGKSPILEHYYDGTSSIDGKNAIIVDDMISSGGSIINTAKELKKLNANKVYMFTTFALFSDGKKSIDLFNKAYEAHQFEKLYTTNLSYVPEEVKNAPWFEEVDCSMQLAQVINAQNQNKSISPYINGDEQKVKKVLEKRKKEF